jgi:hypothetical protein
VYDPHVDEINKALAEHLSAEPERGPLMASITADGMEGQSRDALLKDEWKPYLETLRRRGET